MAKPKSTTSPDEISEIIKLTTGIFECCVVGRTPLILNRMSEKAKHQLLNPSPRKNAVERSTTMKHNPVEEYRASAYTIKDESSPTLLAHLSTAFKGALCGAALDLPGMKKAQIGRLTWVKGDYVNVWGVPKLFMSVVRSADMNKTPDIRTRAIVPRWAARVTIEYSKPLIRAQAVANLLAASGLIRGVGDWRPEKGSGSYGQFQIVDQDDPEFNEIVRAGGRAAQVEALENPTCYDDETTEMLAWFQDEVAKRKLRGVA